MLDPSYEQHLEGAQALTAKAQELSALCNGWAITALFYAAVHWVRSYLVARHQRHVEAHEAMRQVWRDFPEMARIRSEYELLKKESEQFRYYLVEFSPDDFSKLKTKLDKIRATLYPRIQKADEDIKRQVC